MARGKSKKANKHHKCSNPGGQCLCPHHNKPSSATGTTGRTKIGKHRGNCCLTEGCPNAGGGLQLNNNAPRVPVPLTATSTEPSTSTASSTELSPSCNGCSLECSDKGGCHETEKANDHATRRLSKKQRKQEMKKIEETTKILEKHLERHTEELNRTLAGIDGSIGGSALLRVEREGKDMQMIYPDKGNGLTSVACTQTHEQSDSELFAAARKETQKRRRHSDKIVYNNICTQNEDSPKELEELQNEENELLCEIKLDSLDETVLLDYLENDSRQSNLQAGADAVQTDGMSNQNSDSDSKEKLANKCLNIDGGKGEKRALQVFQENSFNDELNKRYEKVRIKKSLLLEKVRIIGTVEEECIDQGQDGKGHSRVQRKVLVQVQMGGMVQVFKIDCDNIGKGKSKICKKMLKGKEELISKIGELYQLYQMIQNDLNDYLIFNDRLSINECDVEHLCGQPWEDDKWTLEMLLDENLSRTLNLRRHVYLAFIYKKNIVRQMTEMKSQVCYLKAKDRGQLLAFINVMISLEKQAFTLMHHFAKSIENVRKYLLWGKHNLHRACGKIFEITFHSINQNKAATATDDTYKRPEKAYLMMCEDCKKFGMESEKLVSELGKYYPIFLNAYYLNPETAASKEDFTSALEKCQELLKEYGYFFEVYTDRFKEDPTLPKPNFIEVINTMNNTAFYIYDPDRYPTVEGTYHLLCLQILKMGMTDEEMKTTDLTAPINNSISRIFLNYKPDLNAFPT